jgi:uncharacterized RDD family membrane protein YckC
MQPSGLWRRSLAAIIDASTVFCLSFLIIMKFGTETSEEHWSLSGIPAALMMLCMALFWIIPEWLTGMSFGKWSCDLHVVDMTGKKISLSQSMKRNILRVVDVQAAYLFGFICAKLTPKQQRLGDLWAKTTVVRGSEIQRQYTLRPEPFRNSERHP